MPTEPTGSEAERWTILRLLQWTTDYLRQQGAETARLDAEVLLAEARGCQRIDLYTAYDEVADERVRTAFRELVRRRAEGTPVAYLVGRREFYSLSFRVSPDVLIPRPETEFVILNLLDLVQADDRSPPKLRIADVGTGSGILAVCAALCVKQAEVVATDIRPEALEVARANARDHHVADRIVFLQGDLLSGVPDESGFDFIVSNPPYVSRSEWAGLSREVKDHEPHDALVAGDSGTEVIGRLITEAGRRLKPGGWLICEISPMIETAVHQLVQRDGRFETSTTVKDLAQLPRVVNAQKK